MINGLEKLYCSGNNNWCITLHDKQAELILNAIKVVYDAGAVTETFTNENHNGNGIYEIVREWAEMKELI